jgi:hypothetical protein
MKQVLSETTRLLSERWVYAHGTVNYVFSNLNNAHRKYDSHDKSLLSPDPFSLLEDQRSPLT